MPNKFRKLVATRKEALGFLKALANKEIFLEPINTKTAIPNSVVDLDVIKLNRFNEPIYQPLPPTERFDASTEKLEDSVYSPVKWELTYLREYDYFNIVRERPTVSSYDKTKRIQSACIEESYITYYTKDNIRIPIFDDPKIIKKIILSSINFEKPYRLSEYANIGFSEKENCWYYLTESKEKFIKNFIFKIVPGMSLSDLININTVTKLFKSILNIKPETKSRGVNEYYESYKSDICILSKNIIDNSSVYKVVIGLRTYDNFVTKNNFVYAKQVDQYTHIFDINTDIKDKELTTLEDCKEAAILMAKLNRLEANCMKTKIAFYLLGVGDTLLNYNNIENLNNLPRYNIEKINYDKKLMKEAMQLAKLKYRTDKKVITSITNTLDKINLGTRLWMFKNAVYNLDTFNAINSLKMPTVNVEITFD